MTAVALVIFIGICCFLAGYAVGTEREMRDWFKWMNEHEERLKTENLRLQRQLAEDREAP